MKKQIYVLLVLFLGNFLTSCSMIKSKTSSTGNSFSIIQGLTSATTTEINILINKQDNPIVSLIDEKSNSKMSMSSSNDYFIEGSEWGTKRIYFSNLTENNDYTLQVKSTTGFIDSRSLRTLDLTKKKPRIAILSCMDDDKINEQKIMWQGLISQSPDMIFLIGDQVYADWKDGKKLSTPLTIPQVWNRYVDSRLVIDLYKSKKLIPTLAIWDDHDYGINDGDETNPIKEDLKKLFYSFYPQNEESAFFSKGPGVSFHFKAFEQNFYFLDNRSFRSPNLMPIICEKKKNHQFCSKIYPDKKGSNQTVFGAETEKWVIELIKKSISPNWLISGDQFFGGYHPFESYEGTHPESFAKFLNQLKLTNKRIIFVSGDRHLSEVMKIEKSLLNYETFEITSSGMHARVFPSGWDEFPNPRQIVGMGQTLNYSIVESGLDKNTLSIKVNAFGPQKKLLYSQDLIVK